MNDDRGTFITTAHKGMGEQDQRHDVPAWLDAASLYPS